MSVTLRHPFRLDAAGSVGVIAQGSTQHALEAARHVVSCRVGERPLAPLWGLADPLADGVDEADIRTAIALCEPDVALSYVDLTGHPDGTLEITLDATWRSNQ